MREWILGTLMLLIVTQAAAQTPICTIQGSGTASTYDGQILTTTGIVAAAYSGTGTIQGFFVEDPTCDANPATSNGLFIYQPGNNVTVGQRVSVTGEVDEFQGVTEIKNVTNVSVLGSGTVTPTDVSLPVASLGDWERYEGMLLRFPQELMVTGNEGWAQYGELVLAPALIMQPTELVDPNDAVALGTTSTGSSNVAAVTARADLNARSTIILDDGRTSTWPSPPPLIGPQGTLRCGSAITALVGVLHYAFSDYRVHPVGAVPLQHSQRPAVPVVGGDLRIAAFNVRNYFTTLGTSGASNSGELQRQRTKLIAALQQLAADAFVLSELENGDPASDDLLAGLNAAMGGGYAVIDHDAPGSFTRSVIFYRTNALQPVTTTFWLNTSIFQRAHITQGFLANASGRRFLLSTMHLRSKLCDGASGANTDQGDGQGCYNAMRRSQVQELVSHWAAIRSSTWIPSQLVMGDFNAYDQEDPIDLMRANGFVDLVTGLTPSHTYRYLAAFGSIDHAFATTGMADAVLNAAPWNINSNEPPVLDYRDYNLGFYQPNAFRSSDHDPVLVGLDAGSIVTSVAAVADGIQVRFRLDERLQLARWEGALPFRVELVDVLGRSLPQAVSGFSTAHEVNIAGWATGAYAWRCVGSDGVVKDAGRMIIR
ncbi:MAG: ExeM/NucH family extracellular endonuclease [Flavobacteriales bacterium]|nr:ExeM/NucH family extracellular endonuclease [Flavobacteriales bacterium]